MPHTLVVAEAKQAQVLHLAKEAVEARGALLDEVTHARIVFEGVRSPGSFARGGYVGVYQAVGDKTVEVLVEAYATGPRQAWWATVALQALAVVALLAISPPSSVFFLASLALWPWLLAAGLLYYLTLRGSRQLEDELHASMLAKLREAGLPVLDEAALLERRVRERLEGERKEGELARAKAQAPRAKGRLGGRPVPAGNAAAEGEAPAAAKRGLFGPRRGKREP